jgi:hypothetical protein
MKVRVWVVLSATLSIAALIVAMIGAGGWEFRGLPVAAAAEKTAETKTVAKPKGPPPLVISKDAPLLLEEPKAKPAAKFVLKLPGQKVADNEPCFVCHTNYREESMAVSHANANHGCVECHGESTAHRNDEDNITPPDIMLGGADIAKNCAKCHEEHNAPADKVIAMWQEKCPARTNPKEMLCTDCHGQHRLKFRTVWWDKKTGKLGERAPGERTRPNPDLTKVPGAKPAPTKTDEVSSPDLEMK